MSPKDAEVLATISTTEVPVEIIKEPVVTYQKFGEMELPEEEEVDDGDYVPSDADSEDSLEWSSETERTMAEDALAEGTVGIDFYSAAYSVATEYVASYAPVQMGLKVSGSCYEMEGNVCMILSLRLPLLFLLPTSSGPPGLLGGLVPRTLRWLKGGLTLALYPVFYRLLIISAEPSMVVSLVNTILNMVGFHLAPAVEDSSKPVRLDSIFYVAANTSPALALGAWH